MSGSNFKKGFIESLGYILGNRLPTVIWRRQRSHLNEVWRVRAPRPPSEESSECHFPPRNHAGCAVRCRVSSLPLASHPGASAGTVTSSAEPPSFSVQTHHSNYDDLSTQYPGLFMEHFQPRPVLWSECLCPPQIHMLKSRCPCAGSKKGGFWEVIRS